MLTHRIRPTAFILLTAIPLAAACSSDAISAPAFEPPLSPVDTLVTPALTYEFGMKFEPPVGRVVHGMGQWVNGNPQYLAMLPPTEQPAAELMFVELGDTPRGWEPAQIAAKMASLHAAGRMPVMDLALRGLQPSQAEYAQLADKTFGIDSAVAYSSKYDARIQSFIDILRAYGHPVMVRIGGEFSGWWNGYHAFAYPLAFRKIVSMFRASGVSNVAFIWCYEPAAANDFDEISPGGQAKWFPGDDMVDWFSIDLFATHDVSGPLMAHNAPSAFGRTVRFLDMAVAHRRPVIIAESSPSQFDLAKPDDAAAAWSQWFTPYFDLIATRSEVKWFHYINYDWSKASYYASSGWKNNDLSLSVAASALFKAELAKPKYLHAGGLSQLNGWSNP